MTPEERAAKSARERESGKAGETSLSEEQRGEAITVVRATTASPADILT